MNRFALGAGAVLLVLLTVGSFLAACSGVPSSHGATRPTLACQAPIAPGRPSIPSPTRLTAARSFRFNGLRLSPPPRGATPAVSAARAWKAVRDLQTGATYKLVLAESNSGEALDGPSPSPLLVWVVIGSHVEVKALGSRNRPCLFESALWPVDASTGVAYGELTY